MYTTKQELLRGYKPIVDFDQNTCYHSFPETESYSIRLLYSPSRNAKDIIGCYLNIEVDRLIGKWLRLDRYFQIPKGQYLSAFLFLQPIWLNHHFEISIYNKQQQLIWKHTPGPNVINFEDPPWIFRSIDRWVSGNGLILSGFLSFELPFVILHSDPGVALLRDDLVCYEVLNKDMRQIDNFQFAPTDHPQFYLLTFSNLLTKAKDCKKLLRYYLKNPHTGIRNGGIQLTFKCQTSALSTSNFHRHNLQWHNSTSWIQEEEMEMNSCNFAKEVYQNAKKSF